MHVVALTPPGRFPTVVPDTGRWWSTLAADCETCCLDRLSANAGWWRTICSPDMARIMTATPMRRLTWHVRAGELERAAARASQTLDALRETATYDSATRYIAAVSPLAEYLALLNRSQDELYFSLDDGVRVTRLDYGDSHALARYARRKTILSEMIAAALQRATGTPETHEAIDLLVVRVTCPEDLLCAMIAVERLRAHQPGAHAMYACLADHGYENFSLSHHLPRLRTAHTLDRIFDGIIESQDDRDVVVPVLARALTCGQAPRGFLRRSDMFPEAGSEPVAVREPRYIPPPPVETFASEPVFWTRISQHRCYWSRCTFCVHNLKYDHPLPPSLGEVPGALDRLEALVNAGYHTFIFADEALSPALLRRFCQAIIERGLAFTWSCRCKLERAFTPELFELMRAAGCYDVLFGLETTSLRMLRRMGKYTEGLDGEAIQGIVEAAKAAGIALHINLIGGFPGDTPSEVTASVDFVIRCLRTTCGATYTLNRFTLFPSTPVMNNPATYGIEPVTCATDMPASYPYRVAPELRADAIAVDRLLPSLAYRLRQELGWTRFGNRPGVQAAIQLYFTSGHSAIFKTRSANAFANPLLQTD
ncbi:MAG TPA: radical SAM protein [Ktedonobacterales bacterium]